MVHCLSRYFRPGFLKTKLVVISFLIIFYHVPSFARPLQVGVIWFPPFYVIEKEGDKVTGIRGINVEIVTRVLDEINQPYHLKYYPAKRLYSNMIHGKIDLFYGIRVPSSHVSSDHILHSNQTISKIVLKAYYMRGTPPLKQKEELIGKSVIVFRGYGYGGFIEYIKNPANRMTIYTADTQINGFKMLAKGRAGYLIAFERPAKAALRRFNEGFYNKVLSSDPLYIADGYFVMSRKTPNAKKLMDRMEKAYNKLDAEGVFDGMIVE